MRTPAGDRFRGARIAEPAFADDRGDVPAGVAAALAAYAADPRQYPQALQALGASRLLVPVVAVPDELEIDHGGRAHDKTSTMAAVLLTGADGRLALLAFTGTAPLHRWDPRARPVPLPAREVAAAALQERAAALVVDVAGPVAVAVEGDDLRALAAGWTLVRLDERWGWLDPASRDGADSVSRDESAKLRR